MITFCLVALGAGIGACARFLTDRAIQARHDSLFPWGTLTANLTGCLLLGFLAGGSFDTEIVLAAGTGFCGALTTYSTFGYETLRLARTRARFYAAANAVASLLAGLGAATTGLILAQAVT